MNEQARAYAHAIIPYHGDGGGDDVGRVPLPRAAVRAVNDLSFLDTFQLLLGVSLFTSTDQRSCL